MFVKRTIQHFNCIYNRHPEGCILGFEKCKFHEKLKMKLLLSYFFLIYLLTYLLTFLLN